MNTNRIYWESKEIDSFDALLDGVPDEALNSPRRSTVLLLEFCRNPANAVRLLEQALGVDASSECNLIFEYAVPVKKGNGKPSFTDLLVLAPEYVIGVEAKYREPEYEPVRAWLPDAPTSNRHDVLEGWLQLIAEVTRKELTYTDVLDLPYQLIHRVASVCSVKRTKRAVAYLVFGKAADHYAKHMRSLATLLGVSGPTLSLLSCPVRPTDAYQELTARWDAGERKLAHDVRNAMRAAPLVSFDDVHVDYHSAIVPVTV